MTWLGAPTLSTGAVTLRPLMIDDAEAIGSLIGDPEVFRWSPGIPHDTASALTYIEAAQAADRREAFAVVDDATGAVVGSTSFYDIDPVNLSAAIGYTFYTDAAQGTVVNPSSKYLLLHHAFETCAAVRVVWHTHENNARSRAAISKLGATFEGLLRKQLRFGDGWRTTAQFAMIDDDWPAAKARLLARMAGR
ncbi:GNAT family N-acetyltransferase [Gordonia sp. TBRC 11910]|uniref:GNAT family N-acetyltransferase n=1 Tax=Gordonia asplenii TaxID=2725283 RepID=A0A848L4G7_9ACTN|nr:GNAT family N-acetyltransferase [Gordonia asplenii]NMO03483.1 GNAT family N-acetyltransferase [Gordonia asplenii]